MVSALSKISSARARNLWTSDRSSVSNIGATFFETKCIIVGVTPGGASGSYADALVHTRFRVCSVIAGLASGGLAFLTQRCLSATLPRKSRICMCLRAEYVRWPLKLSPRQGHLYVAHPRHR